MVLSSSWFPRDGLLAMHESGTYSNIVKLIEVMMVDVFTIDYYLCCQSAHYDPSARYNFVIQPKTLTAMSLILIIVFLDQLIYTTRIIIVGLGLQIKEC